jgi:hypothetical protein
MCIEKRQLKLSNANVPNAENVKGILQGNNEDGIGYAVLSSTKYRGGIKLKEYS